MEENISFRKPTSFIQPNTEKTSTTEQKPEEKKEFTNSESEKIKNEERKMFFYYPKYLQPEAVALIAQNLLNEWEKE